MKTTIKNFSVTVKTFLVPILSIIAITILLYIPRADSFWNFIRLTPFYAGIYFWQSQRPDIFNIFSTFILGIFADTLESTLLGINILTFLTLYITAVQISEHFNIKRFSYSWLLFGISCLITFTFKALIISILYRQIISLDLLVIECLMTIAIYPLLARIYILAEKKFIHLEDTYEEISR